VSAERKLVASLSAIDSRGRGVRVRFYLQNARVSHQIDAINGLLSYPLLESVEDGQIADWPVSPPLQNVSVSQIVSDSQQGKVAMLTGSTFYGHWSMCVAARDREGAPPHELSAPELFFDIACRTDGTAAFLGSSYRSMVGPIAISDPLHCAFIPADKPGCIIVSQNGECEVAGNHSKTPVLRCKAIQTPSIESPATIRWQYAVRRSSGGPFSPATKVQLT
jgi:hypothetical protein